MSATGQCTPALLNAASRRPKLETVCATISVYFTEFCQAFHAKAATWFTRALPPWDRVRRGWSERSDACPKFLILGLLGLGRDCQFVRAFPPGVSFQRNFIGVMDEAI